MRVMMRTLHRWYNRRRDHAPDNVQSNDCTIAPLRTRLTHESCGDAAARRGLAMAGIVMNVMAFFAGFPGMAGESVLGPFLGLWVGGTCLGLISLWMLRRAMARRNEVAAAPTTSARGRSTAELRELTEQQTYNIMSGDSGCEVGGPRRVPVGVFWRRVKPSDTTGHRIDNESLQAALRAKLAAGEALEFASEELDELGAGDLPNDGYIEAGDQVLAPLAPWFIPEHEFIKCVELPRRGINPDFTHPVTRQRNANLVKPYADFDHEKTCFVFVSHRWLRAKVGPEGHPDNAEGDKHLLLKKVWEKLRGPEAEVPVHMKFAMWVDYGCIDQDGEPGKELVEQLRMIMTHCDMMVIPVVDPAWEKWHRNLTELPDDVGWLANYKAANFVEYLERGWCRMELMAASLIMRSHQRRARLFHGVCSKCLARGITTIKIFGTREVARNDRPQNLPPLAHSIFDSYKPSEGKVTNQADVDLINGMEADARLYFMPIEVGWDKGYAYTGGAFAGVGRIVYDNGASYEGECRDGKKHGWGTNIYASGEVYEGEWEDDKRHGPGKYLYSHGGVYEGEWRDHNLHGRGTLTFPSGQTYEGQFVKGKRHGQGMTKYPSGDVFEGQYANGKKHGAGIYITARGSTLVSNYANENPVGEGVQWSTTRETAWTCSLQ